MTSRYRRDGTPYSEDNAGLFEWAKDMEGNRHVGKTRTLYGETVSTVWMGLDHSFMCGPPLIFETMVFGRDRSDCLQLRYSTEAEALAGHHRVCKQAVVPPFMRRWLFTDWY